MNERVVSKQSAKKNDWILREFYRLSTRTKPPYPPKVNQTIGSWLVIGAWTNSKGFLQAFKCKCICGHIEEYVNVSNLKIGNTTQCKSCAQKNRDTEPAVKWSDGCFPTLMNYNLKNLIKSRLSGMISRCNQQHHIDNDIKVYYRWVIDPSEFVQYIISLPGWYKSELIPDRIDSSGNYEPGNIRFITEADNARNKTNTRMVQYNGEEIDAMSFIENEFGVKRVSDNQKLYNFVYAKIKLGLSGEQIVKYVKMKRLV